MIQHHLVVRPLVAAGLIAIGATTSPASAMQTSSCAESAAVIRAAQPDYPALSESRGDSGTAYVRISLLSNGRLADATIDQSSGIAALDKAEADASSITS